MSKPDRKLIKTKWGFYQFDPLPSEEELEKYYAEKYFQTAQGSYDIVYRDEEIKYFRLKARLLFKKSAQILKTDIGKSLLDIGCGEGWVLDEFHKQGMSVCGLDFSRYAIEKFNPHLLDFFQQGNIYQLLENKSDKKELFDITILANVIEHVTNPELLLKIIRSLMKPGSLLIIVAPNDFSPLHTALLDKKFISKEFWLAYPDHLSYFNKESMSNFLSECGFRIHSIVADNPIDLNLLNDNSNYIEDPTKGKNTHLFRVRMDNFLASIDEEKLLAIYENFGSMGVGRDLTYFCLRK